MNRTRREFLSMSALTAAAGLSGCRVFAGGERLPFEQKSDGGLRVTLPASEAFDRMIRLKVN